MPVLRERAGRDLARREKRIDMKILDANLATWASIVRLPLNWPENSEPCIGGGTR